MKNTLHIADTEYESSTKSISQEPFLTVKKARSNYLYSERPGMDSVAFILMKNNKFALINESKPPMDERSGGLVRMTTAFGGSCDMPDETLESIVQIEVLEEAGYDVSVNDIHFIGQTMVSTQSSQICHLFLVDVGGIDKTQKAEYETGVEGKGISIKWLTKKEVIKNDDWKSIFIITKAKYLSFI